MLSTGNVGPGHAQDRVLRKGIFRKGLTRIGGHVGDGDERRLSVALGDQGL